MGNDSTLRFRRDENDVSECLFESSSTPCLLWLCCFRLNDFDIDRYGGITLGCPIERAINQLSYGVGQLEKSLGSIRYLREYKSALEFVLNEKGSGDLLIDFEDTCYVVPRLLDFIVHSISGFWNPDLKIFYSEKERTEWDSPIAPPGLTGVVTWAGALQRTSIPWHNPQEGYDKEGIDAFDWDIHSMWSPRRYLLGC